MSNLRLLLKFIKNRKFLYLGAIIAINFSAIFQIIIPLVIRTTIDSVVGEEPFALPVLGLELVQKLGGKEGLYNKLWLAGLAIVILTALQGFFSFLKGKLSALASESSGKQIREDIYNHVQHLPYDYHIKVKTGDLIQRCTSDVETAQNFVSNQLIQVFQILFSFTYIFITMLTLDIKYSLLTISIFPVIVFITYKFFSSMKKVFKNTDESEGRMSSVLQENLTGVRVVKAFGAQRFEIEKFDEKNSDYKNNIKDIVHLMSNFWSSSDFLNSLQVVIVILGGIYWANKGVITLGTFVAFSTYIGMLMWPIRQLGQIFAFMGQAFISLTRIQEILDQPIETPSDTDLKPDIEGDIQLTDVCFEYADSKPLLKNISMNIKKGQTVAILGPTGSGKSSLMHLLVRLYDYTKGSIKIDGIELKHIDKKWIRQNIGIVLQEPFLFSRSIKENIIISQKDIQEYKMFEACEIACIHRTISDFEMGYETIIGERGVTLSGGQRQRLAIARTVIMNLPILIFDDSLSAVDMETDAKIRETLKIRSRNTTTIIISHRITTLSQADVIYVIEEGTISQCGSHKELIASDGLYRRIWDIQNALEEEICNDVM